MVRNQSRKAKATKSANSKSSGAHPTPTPVSTKPKKLMPQIENTGEKNATKATANNKPATNKAKKLNNQMPQRKVQVESTIKKPQPEDPKPSKTRIGEPAMQAREKNRTGQSQVKLLKLIEEQQQISKQLELEHQKPLPPSKSPRQSPRGKKPQAPVTPKRNIIKAENKLLPSLIGQNKLPRLLANAIEKQTRPEHARHAHGRSKTAPNTTKNYFDKYLKGAFDLSTPEGVKQLEAHFFPGDKLPQSQEGGPMGLGQAEAEAKGGLNFTRLCKLMDKTQSKKPGGKQQSPRAVYTVPATH